MIRSFLKLMLWSGMVGLMLLPGPLDFTAQAVSIPTIPQPDFLPGPDETADQAAVQSYFRDQAVPGFIAGFMGLLAALALLALIVAGIRFMTAYGNEEAITSAKKMAIWTVVGFGITLLAYAIVTTINTLAFPKVSTENQYTEDDQETVEYDSI